MAIKAKTRGTGKAFVGPEVQVAFPALKEPKAYEQPGAAPGKPKYSITGLVSKEDSASLQELFDALTSYWGAENVDDLPGHPFVNGNTGELNDGDADQFAEYTGYAGNVFFRASTGFDDVQSELYTEIEMDGTACDLRQATPDEIHGGCIGKPILTCAEYKVGKNHGVTFYLQGFVKTRMGEFWSNGENQTKNLLGIKKNTAVSTVKMALSASSKPVAQEQEVEEAPESDSDITEEVIITAPEKAELPAKKAGLIGLTGQTSNSVAKAPATKKGNGLTALLQSGGK